MQWCAGEPLGWWPLGFFGLAALWGVSTRASAGAAAWWGFIWGSSYFLLLFDWAASAAHTVLAQIGLAAVEAMFVALVALLWNGASRYRRAAIPLAAVIWVAVEYVRSTWPLGGMPWGSVGYTFVDSPLVRLAPYGSVELVSLVAVGVSIALAQALRSRRKVAIAGAVVVGAGVVGGSVFLPIGAAPSGHLDAAIVQGSVPSPPGPDRALTVTRNHVEAALGVLEKNPDVIFLPESTSDLDFRRDPDAGALIERLTSATDVPILLGSQSYSGNTRLNEYILLVHGKVTATYAKQHPVPFGEYIPWREQIRAITRSVDQVAVDMIAGSDPAAIRVPVGKADVMLATPICFEIADTAVVAEAVRLGAELIVAPTNNATFQGTGEPHQQFAIARFRAIETARSVVQVSTSGITGVIDPRGNVAYSVIDNVPDARVVRVQLADAETFSTRTEPTRVSVTYALGAVGGILAVRALLSKKRRTRQ